MHRERPCRDKRLGFDRRKTALVDEGINSPAEVCQLDIGCSGGRHEILGKIHSVVIGIHDTAGKSHSSSVEDREIERDMLGTADELQRRLLSRDIDGVNRGNILVK